MRKIWAFFWYQNLQKFEKNLKQLDRAPLNMFNDLKEIDFAIFLKQPGKLTSYWFSFKLKFVYTA